LAFGSFFSSSSSLLSRETRNYCRVRISSLHTAQVYAFGSLGFATPMSYVSAVPYKVSLRRKRTSQGKKKNNDNNKKKKKEEENPTCLCNVVRLFLCVRFPVVIVIVARVVEIFLSRQPSVYMPCNNNMTTVELFKSPVVKR
jgi:H+/gluconate symporter-like permease